MFYKNIDVAEGFQTSINIAYDLNNLAKVQAFIPTLSSLDIIEDVLLSTANNATQRARILVGAYGRGKSHIVLVLMALLSKQDKTFFTSLLDKMKEFNEELYEYTLNYLNGREKLLPIVVRGSNTSLSSSFLNALQLSLNEKDWSDIMPETHFQAVIRIVERWKKDYNITYKNFVKVLGEPVGQFIIALQEYDIKAYEKFLELYPKLTSGSTFNPYIGFDIIELYESVAKKIKSKGYTGLYIVYDEFSKYLEASIANATISDIKLLQDFAEKCSRSGEIQMHLMLIGHKDLSNYIDGNLPKEKIDGWRGVSGRFKHLELHNNYGQTYEIISAVIKKDESFWKKYKINNDIYFSELLEEFTKNKLLDENNLSEINDAIYGCYPMHPISTFILPRLSERVAQNERTLFTFLSSNEHHTLSAFIKSAKADFPLLTPDYLYNYFEPLIRKEPYTSEIYKIYKLASIALQKLDSLSLEAKIIKTIALIYIVEQFEKLSPTVDVIFNAFKFAVTDSSLIDNALRFLIDNECIVYLKRSNGYLRIKESSGVDIRREISSYIEKNRSVLKMTDILNTSAFDSFMYPTSYNDEFEIIRYFDFIFIDAEEFLLIQDFKERLLKSTADGIIYAVIPSNYDELKKLKLAINKNGFYPERLVVIIPSFCENLEKITFEYEAVKKLREQVSESDFVLADEYDMYIDDLSEVIGIFINNYTRPEKAKVSYYYMGNKEEIFRKAQLSDLLSRICEQVFYLTPIINNESINKNIISSMAIKSRTKILAGLLDNELKPNLGLIGTGQEMSIMRSTLVQTNILLSPEEAPVLDVEPDNKNIAYVLSMIQEFFNETSIKGVSNFGSLYERLTLPDYGVGIKRGVIPIYLAVILHFNKHRLAIKCNGREEQLTPDLMNSINESPSDYTIFVEDWSETKIAYLNKLEATFKKHVKEQEKKYNSFLYILYAMNRWYMALPKYSKEVTKIYQGQTETAKPLPLSHMKFINSLKTLDENPREYLFEKIVKIFNLSEPSENLAQLIQIVKEERDNMLPTLLQTLTDEIKEIFSGRFSGITLASAVSNWYDKLYEHTLRQLFVGSENQILSLISCIDNDETLFIQKLARLVTGLRIEDWKEETVDSFLQELSAFKLTVDNFNNKKLLKENTSAEYKIIFKDNDGKETVRIFDKAQYTETAELMLGEVTRVIDEYNQSLSEQEKRQVIMDILERLCMAGV